jgi:hypothetical protein
LKAWRTSSPHIFLGQMKLNAWPPQQKALMEKHVTILLLAAEPPIRLIVDAQSFPVNLNHTPSLSSATPTHGFNILDRRTVLQNFPCQTHKNI